MILPGEKVAVDGVVEKGTSSLNTAALTGESLPVFVEKGTEILSGSLNIDGMIEVRVTKEYKDSAISKIIEMVENASDKKADAEKFITKFARYYTPVVVWKSFNFPCYFMPLCSCSFSASYIFQQYRTFFKKRYSY